MANYVQGGSANGSSAAPSVTLADAPIEGNVLTAVVVTNNSRAQVAAPDWTQIPSGDASHSCAYWRVAGGGESATQTPCSITSAAWLAQVVEHAGILDAAPLNVSGTTADDSSPVTLAAINPTDNIQAILVAIATAYGATPSWSGQTIGGAAATERVDGSGSNVSACVFDRLDVDTGTGTWAAAATASADPNQGNIYLLIYEALTAIMGAAAVAAVSTVDAAGSVYKTGAAAVVGASSVAVAGVMQYAGAAVVAAVSSVAAVSRTLDVAGSVSFSEAVRGSAVLSLAARGTAALAEAVRGSVVVSVAPVEV